MKNHQKINEISLRFALADMRQNIKDSFLSQKPYFGVIGLLFAITALFLNVSDDNIALKRIQAFFLLLCALIITYLFILIILKCSKGEHNELYYAFHLFLIFGSGLLIYNLFDYLFLEFGNELYFYFKWLGIPSIAIIVNLLYLYFLKLLNFWRISVINKSNLENFFLLVLNLHLIFAYSSNKYEFLPTLHQLFSLSFSNLQIVYLFFVTVLSELPSFNKIIDWFFKLAPKRNLRRLILSILLFALIYGLPLILKFLIEKIF